MLSGTGVLIKMPADRAGAFCPRCTHNETERSWRTAFLYFDKMMTLA
ncbi:hypothetical protein KCP69_19705 [Salmonella enterica subsp. enterica]|nr:hypothetical protein KCP69_19705 [Salmonella enterica subsp. enterica]